MAADYELSIEPGTEFLKCCAGGDVEQVRELVKNGKLSDGDTSSEWLQGMLLASSRGHFSVVECLHGAGVSLVVKEASCGLSAFDVSCLSGHEDLIRCCVEKGCSLTKLNKFGATPLHYVCYHSMKSLLSAVTKSNVDSVSEGGFSLLHYATGMGSFSFVEHLVMLGADVNCWDSYGNYPLHFAAAAGVLESVFLLVEVGRSPVDCLNEYGQTPFLVACRSGHLEVAQWLASASSGKGSSSRGGGGANVFIEDQEWTNALHAATLSGNHVLVSFLASLGVSVLSKSKSGKTPVDMAADSEMRDLLEKLEAEKWVRDSSLSKTGPVKELEPTAPACESVPEPSNEEEPVPQQRVKKTKKKVKAKEKERKAATVESVVPAKSEGCESQSPPAAPEETGIDRVTEGDWKGDSTQETPAALHEDPLVNRFFLACVDGDEEYVQWHVDHHRDVFACNRKGSQAIHFAAQGGHLNILQLLYKAGAELEVFNDNGMMPMTAACANLKPGRFSVVKWMASQGMGVSVMCWYACLSLCTRVSVWQHVW